MGELIDMVGQKFDRLTVISRGPKGIDTRACWICQCTCGNQKNIPGRNLRKGITNSCGCFGIEWSSSMGANREFVEKRRYANATHRNKTHGQMTPEYKTWLGIKARCHRPKHPNYKHYGARGIIVCEACRNSFETFLADIGPRPSPTHQIDRENSFGITSRAIAAG